jgi:glutaredoxin 3
MIKIVSKNICPYCVMAKELISSLWFDYEEIDVSDGPDKLREIIQISMMMTVPQIYDSEIKKLHDEWKLVDILKS